VYKHSEKFLNLSKDLFSDDREVYFYGVSITRLSKDIQIRIHADIHEDFSDLVYSGVMYLNDDYEGGEITFVDSHEFTEKDIKMDYSKGLLVPFPIYEDSLGGFSYKPVAGDIVIFPANKLHGGKVVIDGTRDAIVFWSTLSKEYAFEGFDSDRVLKKIRS
jgi:predicted 2-oxoglutarate/Fe(II)-dependent dioxygenase YbiX